MFFADWVSLKGAGIFDSKLRLNNNILVAGPIARYTDDLVMSLQVLAPTHAVDLDKKIAGVKLENLTVW